MGAVSGRPLFGAQALFLSYRARLAPNFPPYHPDGEASMALRAMFLLYTPITPPCDRALGFLLRSHVLSWCIDIQQKKARALGRGSSLLL